MENEARSKEAIRVLLVALLALCSFGSCRNATQRTEQPINTVAVTLKVRPNPVPSRGLIEVSYELQTKDRLQIVSGLDMTLREPAGSGKVLWILIARDQVPGAPAYMKPPGQVQRVALIGTGPYRFLLPDVKAGAYRLCQGLALRSSTGTVVQRGTTCSALEVVVR
jgi:hypothetical protein